MDGCLHVVLSSSWGQYRKRDKSSAVDSVNLNDIDQSLWTGPSGIVVDFMDGHSPDPAIIDHDIKAVSRRFMDDQQIPLLSLLLPVLIVRV